MHGRASGYWRAVLLSLVMCNLLLCSGSVKHLQSCHVAQLQCHSRSGCHMALNNFFINCHSVIKGEQANKCPIDCKHALVSLLSTEDEAGLAFINCDCNKGGLCSERKERVKVCQREVLDSMHVLREDSLPVSCNLARWICEADTSCLTALQYYYDHCSRLFSGLKCTPKCRNSLEILSRQPHARKLRSCTCDGSEDYNCQALKLNTETMCFHSKQKTKADANSVLDSDNISKDLDEHLTKKKLSEREKMRSKRRKRRNRALKNMKKAQREKRRQQKKLKQEKKKMAGVSPTPRTAKKS